MTLMLLMNLGFAGGGAVGTAYSLDAEPGSYAVAGAVAGLVVAHAFNAEVATYAVTGAAAGVVHNAAMSADPGDYALTGAAAGLARAVVVSADPGTYTWSGVPATLVDPSTEEETPNNWHAWAEISVRQDPIERTKREQKW